MKIYTLSGPDNDSYMCACADRVFEGMPGLTVCPTCGYKTDIFYINSKFKIKSRVHDLSYTYDGYCIVSIKFREACLRAKLTSASFHDLPLDPGYCILIPDSVVAFDAERRKTRFEDLCNTCGYYGAVVGIVPAYLKEQPSADICRTDILFGSGNEKHPLIVVNEIARNVFTREKLKGLEYSDVIV